MMDKQLFYQLIKPYADSQSLHFYYMEKVKIIINSQHRSIVIPLEYDAETDSAELKEVQVDPVPEKDEVIDGDIAFTLAEFIIKGLNREN